MKTKNLNVIFILAATISLIGVYACSTTTGSAIKTNVAADNTELPDRGIGNTKPDKRNKNGILKEAVHGKYNGPLIDTETEVTLLDYSFRVGTDDNKDGGENESGNGSIEIAGL